MRDSSSGSPSETTGMCVASSTVCTPKTASKASSRGNEVEVGGLAGELYHASQCGQGIGLDSRADLSSPQPEPHGQEESEGLPGGVVLRRSDAGPELAKVVLCEKGSVPRHWFETFTEHAGKTPRAGISGKKVFLQGP